MTLFYIDGAEVGSITERGRWASASLYSYTAALPRTGTYSIATSGGDSRNMSRGGPEHATWIVGFAYRPTSLGANNIDLVRFTYGGATHVLLRQDATTGNLRILHGDTTELVDTSTSVAAGTWQYIEFKATIHDTTGLVEVKLDEVSIGSASNVDTQNGGSALIDGITVNTHGGGGVTYYFDDWYMCTGAGSNNNDFLGEVVVEALFPDADGNSSDFTALGLGDNYVEVDESPTSDDDTTYVHSNTAGHKDTYSMGNMATAQGNVMGVIVSAWAKKDQAGSRGLNIVARSGVTESDSSTEQLLSEYGYVANVYETDPNTAALWTIAGVNAAEFGMKVS